MNDLYDVHCHLIPGVDDGSKDMEESLKALQEEYEEGVRHIICTSHISFRDKTAYEKQAEVFLQLKAALEKTEFGKEMDLYLGNELYYTDSIVEMLKEGQIHTMAGSQYILVEFRPTVEYSKLYKGIRNLVNEGYLPILAHMERYDCLTRQEGRMEELEELGLYFQVNAATVTGELFSKKARYARKLMKEGRIQFLGTDSHGIHYRPPKIRKAAKWIRKHCSEEIAAGILEINPECVLRNEVI